MRGDEAAPLNPRFTPRRAAPQRVIEKESPRNFKPISYLKANAAEVLYGGPERTELS
jgi:hypothetical protein